MDFEDGSSFDLTDITLEVKRAAIDAVDEMRNHSPEWWFLRSEYCELDPDAKVRPHELYNAYASWAEGSGLKPKSLTQVSPIWQELGLRRVTIHGYVYYRGVTLLIVGDELLSFNRWLVRQRRRDDPVGYLGGDAAEDPGWPKGHPTLEELVAYLEGYRPPRVVLDALHRAWSEWSDYRGML